MNQAILDFVGKTLIDIGNKIKEGKCELTDEQASLILGTVGHIEMNLEQACKYVNLKQSRFRDLVRDGTLPKGHKKAGNSFLVWYKDELDIAIRQSQSRLTH